MSILPGMRPNLGPESLRDALPAELFSHVVKEPNEHLAGDAPPTLGLPSGREDAQHNHFSLSEISNIRDVEVSTQA